MRQTCTDRACNVQRALSGADTHISPSQRDIITEQIRACRDDALEEAAKLVGSYYRGYYFEAADAIRALKDMP